MQYLKNPDKIYERSFSIVRSEARLDRIPQELRPLLVRLMHASGMTDLVDDIRFDRRIVQVTVQALKNGATIITDSEMTASAIIKTGLPADNAVKCYLNNRKVPVIAANRKTTRSAAAVDLWEDHIANSIVVIGNAPTTLFALLEHLDNGFPSPHSVFAFPVGFVGASESKLELCHNSRGIPFITLLGRRGGSAMAGAAINALTQCRSEDFYPLSATDVDQADQQ